MKKYPTIKSTLLVSLLMLLHSTTVFSQGSLTGIISDETSGEKIRGAVVSIEHTFLKAITDANGNFTIANVKNGPMKLHVTHLAYQDYSEEIKSAGSPLAIRLKEKTVMADEVNVVATRAGGKSAIAYTNLEKEEIEKQNLGQDLPYLLNMTPSVVVTSDAGTGVGYTGIRIRGSDATRVNVTINGIPVNDAEGHLVYWVDLPDFASSVDNIQIQRGIGTSTNGAGAFGGSVNIQSTKLSAEPFASVNSSFGSFNTMKNTVQFGTGLLNKTFAMEGRFSKITSDGYIDRATSDLKSFYLSGGYYGNKSSLRMILFSGKEKTYQAWYGVPQEKLNGNTDSLMNHYYNNLGYVYFTPQDSLNLFNSNNRTYNLYTYPNQTDNYQQDYYQLLYSRSVNANWNLNAALHYTKGKGYYEEYEHAQSLAAYHLDTMFINNDTVVTTNLVRQRWLDNDFYGFTFSTNYTKTKMRFSLGGAGNRYHGKHYDEVTWMEKNPGTPFPYRYADNDATKNDFTVFAKLNYEITSRLEAYGDVQYRTITYEFPGFD
ncbi:MAG: TonB-dependent receptor, partial [Bacteroidetes bacterium]|nr:TonB-dependent receptor [Bacteroidota bacterium]